jgi:hypothetical protein
MDEFGEVAALTIAMTTLDSAAGPVGTPISTEGRSSLVALHVIEDEALRGAPRRRHVGCGLDPLDLGGRIGVHSPPPFSSQPILVIPLSDETGRVRSCA